MNKRELYATVEITIIKDIEDVISTSSSGPFDGEEDSFPKNNNLLFEVES